MIHLIHPKGSFGDGKLVKLVLKMNLHLVVVKQQRTSLGFYVKWLKMVSTLINTCNAVMKQHDTTNCSWKYHCILKNNQQMVTLLRCTNKNSNSKPAKVKVPHVSTLSTWNFCLWCKKWFTV